MEIIFTSFFASLIGIIIMIGRKMKLVQNGVEIEFSEHPLLPDIAKLRALLYRNTRKLGYLALVLAMRLHFKSTKLMRERYRDLKFKVKNKLMQEPDDSAANGNSNPSSRFLKLVSEYKHKVRRLKHRIKEEEK